MFLSVIIPAYNEEKRLPETLKKVKDYLSTQEYEYEVLIVNDGSRDKTVEVLQQFLNPKFEIRNSKQIQNSKFKNFKLIDNKVNQGKGAVVKQGMLAARGNWRLFMDADGSTDISQLDKFWQFIKLNPKHEALSTKQYLNSNDKNSKKFKNFEFRDYYEVVIGSRYLKAGSIKVRQPLSRRMVSRLGNFLVRILLGIKSVDTQCGFKLFSKEATEEIFPKQTITRWGFDMEILAIAIKKGYKIKEVPVDWYNAEGSTVKKSAALKTLKELLQIKWRMVRGKY